VPLVVVQQCGGGPTAVPPSATTTRSGPELAARTELSANVEEDMSEFLGTDGGRIAYEMTGLTAAAEEVVAAGPELVWDLVADITRVAGGARNASGRPGSGSPAGRSPAPGSPGTTGFPTASSMR
jgi:hypothetical protein